jgi:hypothetical protein
VDSLAVRRNRLRGARSLRFTAGAQGVCAAWAPRVGAAALLFLGLITAALGEPPLREYEVKAAYLLNFTKFVEWPVTERSANPVFSICLLGDDPFDGALDRIVEGESVNGRKIVVQRIHRPQTVPCDMVFVHASERDLSGYLSSLGPGVLTVGEDDHFLREGGMIAFVLDQRRVRFDVNPRAASAAALKLSSKLMSVARNIER